MISQSGAFYFCYCPVSK